jgi:hypothetical protein
MFENPNGSQEITGAQVNVDAVQQLPEPAVPKFPVLQPRLPDPPIKSLRRKRAAILILGVHRSGTSSLVHLLSLLGAKLPEQLLGPGHGNPLGHWESARLMQINEEILGEIGRIWHDPRPIPPGWFRSKAAYGFHERIRAAIESEYGGAELILIKEPRICRLAPLYLDVLDALRIEPLIVLPIRHPAEVICSIRERDRLEPATIELLWLRSLLEAEEASSGCVRVWTGFEDLLGDWEATVRSIANGFGVVWPNEPEEIAHEAADILRTRHRHFRATDDAVLAPIGPLTTRAWQAAQYGLHGEEAAAQALFDEIRTVVTELDRLSAPFQEGIEMRLATAESERRWLEEGLANSTAQISHLRDDCERRRQEIESIRATANDQISSLTSAVESLNARISSMLASRCWQITAPLRALQRWIAGHS